MAVFTRVNGNANGVVNVDIGAGSGIGAIVSTGIGKHPTMFKIDTGSVSLQAQTGTGGAVETILRLISTQATIIAFQVENDGSGEMRVMVEATGWSSAGALETAIQALGTVNLADLSASTVAVVGFKS